MKGSTHLLGLTLVASAACLVPWAATAQVVVLQRENRAAEATANRDARAARSDRHDAQTDRAVARYDEATGHDRAAAEARGAARAESRDARQEQRASNRADNRADQGPEVIIRP